MRGVMKKTGTLIGMMLLMLLFWTVPASADAADYDIRDYQVDKQKVVVQAQDGSGYLYHRYGPSMEYEILSNIYDGTVLEIEGTALDPSGNFRWGNTKYNGRWGWVSMKHTVPYTESTSSGSSSQTAVDQDVVVQAVDGSGYLYLRSGPGMDYQIYCNIYDGEKLHITAESPDSGGQFVWGKTVYNGQEGWVSLKQTVTLEAYEKANPTATPTPTAEPKPTATPTPTAKPTPTAAPEPTEEPVEEESTDDKVIRNGVTTQIKADQNTYTEEDSVKVTLSVRNDNEEEIDSIRMEQVIPEGYELAEGSVSSLEIDSLGEGETVELTVVLQKKGTAAAAEDTNSSGNTLLMVVAAAVAVLIAAILLVVLITGKKKEKYDRLNSFVLALLLGTSLIMGTSAAVSAADPVTESVRVFKTVSIAGETTDLTGYVTYTLPMVEAE